MINRQMKEQQLINSGIYGTIRNMFYNRNIPDKYIMLIADYIDSLSQLDRENGLYLDPVQIAYQIPKVLKSIQEAPMGVYGVTIGDTIIMNSNNSYEVNKLYFFHELTHIIQTRKVNNHEETSFYNGDTGMFLAEGATQFTAEILYNISNDTNLQYKEQPYAVRGLKNHSTYSALSEYQLNGNIILLMSYSLGIPLNQILALAFRSNGRELLKNVFEAFPGKQGKFEEFMFDLEKIYSIDKIQLTEQAYLLNSDNPVNMLLMDSKRPFKGNLKTENELINKIERELISMFIENNDEQYIIDNYKNVSMFLTTPELKRDFNNAVQIIINMRNQNGNTQR